MKECGDNYKVCRESMSHELIIVQYEAIEDTFKAVLKRKVKQALKQNMPITPQSLLICLRVKQNF